jgi:hypothetical protein
VEVKVLVAIQQTPEEQVVLVEQLHREVRLGLVLKAKDLTQV